MKQKLTKGLGVLEYFQVKKLVKIITFLLTGSDEEEEYFLVVSNSDQFLELASRTIATINHLISTTVLLY